MSATSVFAVLPYLKTSERVRIRGIEFRSNRDLDDLLPAVRANLAGLCEMFYLQDGLRIEKMTCAYLEVPADQEERAKVTRHLNEAHLLIAYLYTSPQPAGDIFLPFENSSLFLFSPADTPPHLGMVVTSLVWQDKIYGEMIKRIDAREIPATDLVPGYVAIRNRTTHFCVAEGSRIYPELPHVTLNFSQDLSDNLQMMLSHAHNWALACLYASPHDDIPQTQSRVFVSLEWYLRSCRESIAETEALVDLAIALESLLKIRQGEGLTERFKDAILTLAGPVPRLDFWLDQFYTARSKAVHEGTAPDLMFYPLEKDQLKKQQKESEPMIPHRSLIEYGRRIFRLCLAGVLSGAYHVRSIGLEGLFVPNQDRIEAICKALNDENIPPTKRLLSVSQLVRELREYSLPLILPEVELNSVLGAVRLILRTFKDTQPILPQATKEAIENFLSKSSNTFLDQFTQVEECAKHLRSEVASSGMSKESEFKWIVLGLLDYAAQPGFKVRCYWETEGTGKSGASSRKVSSSKGSQGDSHGKNLGGSDSGK